MRKLLLFLTVSLFLLALSTPARADWPCADCLDDGCRLCHNTTNLGQLCPNVDSPAGPGLCWDCCTACPPVSYLTHLGPAEIERVNARAKKQAEDFHANPLTEYGKLLTGLSGLMRFDFGGMPKEMKLQAVHDQISPKLGAAFRVKRLKHYRAVEIFEATTKHIDQGKTTADYRAALDLREAERRYR